MNKKLKPITSINPYPNITSSEKLPTAFVNFFQDKITKLHKSLITSTETASLSDEYTFDGMPFDQFIPVTQESVSNALCFINSTTCQLDPTRYANICIKEMFF